MVQLCQIDTTVFRTLGPFLVPFALLCSPKYKT
ncbi:hypothetical protein F383_39148 [Gossypium arboreum]|uniref:Uncharacterized protein n=1 Tax=Gossypium arboreum TaxID=29729 RepID=A0A0B0MNI1_GOSAR|nr:hypothetical protein F383_39148 [Gossypium arboreum]